MRTPCFLPGKMEKHPRHEDLQPILRRTRSQQGGEKMGWMIPKRAEPNPHVVRVPLVMEQQEVNKVVASGRSIGRTEPCLDFQNERWKKRLSHTATVVVVQEKWRWQDEPRTGGCHVSRRKEAERGGQKGGFGCLLVDTMPFSPKILSWRVVSSDSCERWMKELFYLFMGVGSLC